MTKLTYVGPHTAVEVPLPPYGQIVAVVERGHAYDFPADFAPGLLEQPTNWVPAKAAPKEKKGGDD